MLYPARKGSWSLVIGGGLALLASGLLFAGGLRAQLPPAAAEPDKPLAQRILEDRNLVDVDGRARALLKSGLNAGSGYPEVWIRDLATFIELACQVNDPADIRRHLILLLRFQGEDGNIPDGVGHRDAPKDGAVGAAPEGSPSPAPLTVTATIGRLVIERTDVPDAVAFKNSVETDQETSLVQAVGTYIRLTGDAGILKETVDGVTVRERLERALEFLLKERWSERYGLIFGGTTIDWGDIAPEDEVGAVFNTQSHRAVDVYDNAMFLLAVEAFLPMIGDDSGKTQRWRAVADGVRANARKYLWDTERGKFVPHLYLDESPFPKEFDEATVWYHGGTAVAILAGLLSRDEVAGCLEAMRRNVRQAGGQTLGLTNYPVYPKGCFQNMHVDPWVYQNGGEWDWFGARMIQALVAYGFLEEAYDELRPMVQRVQRHDGFYEWFDMQDRPQGSGMFKGSAGELASAIARVREEGRRQKVEGPSRDKQ